MDVVLVLLFILVPVLLPFLFWLGVIIYALAGVNSAVEGYIDRAADRADERELRKPPANYTDARSVHTHTHEHK